MIDIIYGKNNISVKKNNTHEYKLGLETYRYFRSIFKDEFPNARISKINHLLCRAVRSLNVWLYENHDVEVEEEFDFLGSRDCTQDSFYYSFIVARPWIFWVFSRGFLDRKGIDRSDIWDAFKKAINDVILRERKYPTID